MTNLEINIKNLKSNEVLKLTPNGTSMCPTFLGGRDEVYVTAPVFPLHRGDIAIFLRETDIYVIHRIYKVKNNQYYFVGDNQTDIEGPIEEAQIHGYISHIVKKGKTIDCNKNTLYKVYSFLWLVVLPFRPIINSIYMKLKHIKSITPD